MKTLTKTIGTLATQAKPHAVALADLVERGDYDVGKALKNARDDLDDMIEGRVPEELLPEKSVACTKNVLLACAILRHQAESEDKTEPLPFEGGAGAME